MYRIDKRDWQGAVELLQTALADRAEPDAGSFSNRYGRFTAEEYFPYYWLGFCQVKRRDRDCAKALAAFDASLASNQLAADKRRKLDAMRRQCAS